MAVTQEGTGTTVLEGRLSKEGRVVIPASVRATLGLEPGDKVQFVVDAAGDVHLTTPRAMIEAVWAQNTRTGGDVEDLIEQEREEERLTEQGRMARWFDDEPGDRELTGDEELLAEILAA